MALSALFVSIVLISCKPVVLGVPTEAVASPCALTSSIPISTVFPSPESIILDVALSPDGSKLAIYSNSGVYIYDTNTLEKTVFLTFDNPDYEENELGISAGAITFSPDGKTLAFSGKFADTRVRLWDIKTGKYLLSVTDIPPAYLVTKIQFSPDGHSIFIRSNYGWTTRCEQADANFALHTLEFSEVPRAIKIFDKDICQAIPTGIIRFTENNKFLVFVQTMGPKYWVTNVDIYTTTSQELDYENFDELYDVSPDGKIYAFLGSQSDSRITKLVDSETSRVLRTTPYRVKLLGNENRFLIREFLSTEDDWGLWENGKITCRFDGLTNLKFDWDLSENGQNFATISSDNDVIIWNVSDCSIKNVLHFIK